MRKLLFIAIIMLMLSSCKCGACNPKDKWKHPETGYECNMKLSPECNQIRESYLQRVQIEDVMEK